ncbi:hypothetical protein F2Q69_00010757 [Brassica cretica]|uniref:Cytochrome P450 n=1 Tax=Brassica cretica TaxID=69181 RepID=A0A8S9QPR6_BRACR|nr:hypothetical protein F2Q69_00010757 [Brassica cretica]
MCPGISMSLKTMPVVLASLLYSFDWKLQDGVVPGNMDMSEGKSSQALPVHGCKIFLTMRWLGLEEPSRLLNLSHSSLLQLLRLRIRGSRVDFISVASDSLHFLRSDPYVFSSDSRNVYIVFDTNLEIFLID